LRDQGIKVEERPISIQELIEANKSGELKEMFGTGTAAVLSNVSEISYKDEIYELPPVEGRKIGPFIKKVLEDYKKSLQPDKFNWLVPVKNLLSTETNK
jgi:branched-chain amino acid aminotransferase